MHTTIDYDCVIAGGGPAGLSAALILGRCRRRVLVCDAGKPRNRAAPAIHGFLSRDGIGPLELLAIGRDQLRPYESVEVRCTTVVDGRCAGSRLEVVLEDRSTVTCRTLLLATGVIDELPDVEGIEALYGRSVFHCPYCDGWEHRDLPVAVYGRGKGGAGLALNVSHWTRDLVLCTDGIDDIPDEDRHTLRKRGVAVRTDCIARLEGCDGILQRVVFRKGEPLPRRAMFVQTREHPATPLAAQLGCQPQGKTIRVGPSGQTTIPGVYVAGDATHDVQLVIVAAGEGARAAFEINKRLLAEEIQRATGS